jgi:hypothetical protein
MKTQILIRDSQSTIELEIVDSTVTVVSGGEHRVEDILTGLKIGRSVDSIAHRVLHRWIARYEGDPVANHLTVDVICGSNQATATI